MPGSFPPDLFRLELPVAVVHSYLGVRCVEDEFGDITHIRLWSYLNGAFVEELAVLDAAEIGVNFGSRGQMALSLAVIHEDPASLVGPSVMWGSSKDISLYDLEAETYYRGVTTAGGEPFVGAPIWGADGWIYYFAAPDDSPFDQYRFHKIRANMTGDSEVSLFVPGGGDLDNVGDFSHLAGSNYYIYSPKSLSGRDDDRIGIFPLNGDPASSEIATGMVELLDEPYHVGIPSGDDAIFLRGAGGELRLGRFTPPSTETILWPSGWADWEDPAGVAGNVLSLSLSADGTEAVVYAAANGTRGIMRTDLAAKTGAEPLGIVVVEQHDGAFPDFMLAMD
jgi:hypothetical protein